MWKAIIGIVADKLIKVAFEWLSEQVAKYRRRRQRRQAQNQQIKDIQDANTVDERIDSFDNLS